MKPAELTLDSGIAGSVKQPPKRSRRLPMRTFLRTGEGLLAVSTATWALLALHLNFSSAGFVQLLIVVIVAMRGGFWAATWASLAANLLLDYFFIPPVRQFSIDDPQNWIAVLVFELSALLVSRLAARSAEAKGRALRGKREMECLYNVSRKLLRLRAEEPALQQIADILREGFAAQTVAVFDLLQNSSCVAGEADRLLEAEVRAACLLHEVVPSLSPNTTIRILYLGSHTLGSVGIQGTRMTPVTADAMANLTTIAIERARAFESESKSEAEKQVERLRTAVLDALAHEIKTPLASIRAAATGLLEMLPLDGAHRVLTTIIDEQSEQMATLTNRLLQTSRLEGAGTGGRGLPLRLETTSVAGLIGRALKLAENDLASERVAIDGLQAGMQTRVDSELMATALSQFFENAGKYSPPHSAVTVRVQDTSTELRIYVRSEGEPIADEERDLLFQRFYRGASALGKNPGSGLGLAFCRSIVEAHGCRTWVFNETANDNVFVLTLPPGKADHE